MVVLLFLAVQWVRLWIVIVVFPDHTHLRIVFFSIIEQPQGSSNLRSCMLKIGTLNQYMYVPYNFACTVIARYSKTSESDV